MNNLLSKSKLFIERNSSTILTCVGAAGVIATAISAVKATPKALQLLEKAKCDKKAELTLSEKIRIAGPSYIPSIVIGGSTIACIFGANALNKRQQAALTGAYALLDSSYKEYRNKVKEIHGDEGHKQIVERISKDRYVRCKDLKTIDNKEDFFDFFSLISFKSTLNDIHNAENQLNYMLDSRGYVLLSEFYDLIGVECGDVDCKLGWSRSSGCNRIEFLVEQSTAADGRNYYILEMATEPSVDFFY